MTGGRLVSRLEVKYLPNLIGALQVRVVPAPLI
jgi:hypothetical protein